MSAVNGVEAPAAGNRVQGGWHVMASSSTGLGGERAGGGG